MLPRPTAEPIAARMNTFRELNAPRLTASDPRLDVWRAEHLVVDQAVLEAGCEAADQVDELAGDAGACALPV